MSKVLITSSMVERSSAHGFTAGFGAGADVDVGGAAADVLMAETERPRFGNHTRLSLNRMKRNKLSHSSHYFDAESILELSHILPEG